MQSSANKFTNNEFDFSQHFFLNEGVEKYCLTLPKDWVFREFKSIILDIFEEEKWYQFFLTIVQYN